MGGGAGGGEGAEGGRLAAGYFMRYLQCARKFIFSLRFSSFVMQVSQSVSHSFSESLSQSTSQPVSQSVIRSCSQSVTHTASQAVRQLLSLSGNESSQDCCRCRCGLSLLGHNLHKAKTAWNATSKRLIDYEMPCN